MYNLLQKVYNLLQKK